MCNYLILVFIILFIWSFLIEPQIITVKKYNLNINLNKQKIIFISDLHISKYDKKRLKRIVEIINKENPDIVLSGGDYIKGHSGKNSLDIKIQAEELAKINAPIVSVLGNHDGKFDKYTVKTALEKNGISVLLNSNISLKGICIAGVDDLRTGKPNPSFALEGTDNPKILITHTPDIYYEIEDNVDLVLAGHVHGGQVRFPMYGAVLVPSRYGKKFAYGIHNETHNTMIVTKGLGTSMLNVRFNCIPEIVVIEGC